MTSKPSACGAACGVKKAITSAVARSGALEGGYAAAAIKTVAERLQEIVSQAAVGSLRMSVGSLAFPSGQALLDWLRATNQPFNAAKVVQ